MQQFEFEPYFCWPSWLGLPEQGGLIVAHLRGYRCYIQASKKPESIWYRLRTPVSDGTFTRHRFRAESDEQARLLAGPLLERLCK